jgi:predicted lactoylglutathione lyase
MTDYYVRHTEVTQYSVTADTDKEAERLVAELINAGGHIADATGYVLEHEMSTVLTNNADGTEWNIDMTEWSGD